MEKQEVSVKEVLEIFIRYPIYDIDNAEVNNKIQKLIDNLGISSWRHISTTYLFGNHDFIYWYEKSV